MKLYFFLYGLIWMFIVYLWLLVTPLKLKVRMFKRFIPYFVKGYNCSRNGGRKKKEIDPFIIATGISEGGGT